MVRKYLTTNRQLVYNFINIKLKEKKYETVQSFISERQVVYG